MNKQTQFRAAGTPHYSTVLSFHHSSPVPVVQTKPNLGTLGYLGNQTRDAEQMRQTNPICARAIWRISVMWTRSCDQWDARAASGKQSQSSHCGFRIADWGTDLPPPACSGRLRQTNPISGSRPLAAVVLMGETPMPRKALRRLPACAGMTLLRTGLLRQTNPISGRAK
jgi:hypothetical protein